jgi:membrane dipeptidase
MGPDIVRRRFLAAAAAAGVALPLRAQPKGPPIADMHSHYGLIQRSLAFLGLAREMREHDVRLLAWKLVADARWIRGTSSGIEQFREPAPGDLAAYFRSQLERMREHVLGQGLRLVQTRADLQAAAKDGGGVVLASEGADFLEGTLAALEPAVRAGLRHLQLVHYIRTPVGDFQTVAPVHGGLSALGRQLVEACGEQGVLVDLAHCTEEAVAQALEVARSPVIWSHGWVSDTPGKWDDRFGFLRRRLSLESARRIAAKGGVIGLWGLGLSRPGQGWSVGARDKRAYAEEIASLVGRLGADHVALGTDIEGVGPNWVVNDYEDVRAVIGHLEERRLPASVIERVAFGNYARVLGEALRS